jgi:RNA polymerase sigma-70 factor (ECF subfamily)
MRRRSDAHGQRIASHVEPDEQPTATRDPQLGREVLRFLASLSEERYQVVVLRYFEDFSIDEIADATGVSRNTVKDRLRVALELLRKHARREEVIALHRRSPP